jgi:hypothetical protein
MLLVLNATLNQEHLLLCSALKICFLTHTGRRFGATQYSLPADASYRLTQEKNGLYPVITTNLAMESKTIAYGIIYPMNIIKLSVLSWHRSKPRLKEL